HVKLEGNVIAHQHDAQIVARPGRIAGIDVADLDEQLAGLKSGETRSIRVSVPESHSNEQMRGKEVEIEIALKDIKLLELADVSPAFLAELGFQTEPELRTALREQMEQKINDDIRGAMREQVNRHLLDNIRFDL